MSIVKNKEDLNERPLAVHPKKFAMWLFLVTIVMVFAALTSAYLVRRADAGWEEFNLPNAFWLSTGIMVLSSITMHWAYICAKKDNVVHLKLALIATVLLGIGFIVGQLIAGQQLIAMKIFFGGSQSTVSGSFLYVLAGLHWFHLVSGIIFLAVVVFNSFNYKIHSRNLLQIELCATYWHFLDFLWLYLFVFLLLNR